MSIMTEEVTDRKLVTAREPKAIKKAGAPGSIGDQAVNDALIAICIGWAFLFFLAFSLRKHNI